MPIHQSCSENQACDSKYTRFPSLCCSICIPPSILITGYEEIAAEEQNFLGCAHTQSSRKPRPSKFFPHSSGRVQPPRGMCFAWHMPAPDLLHFSHLLWATVMMTSVPAGKKGTAVLMASVSPVRASVTANSCAGMASVPKALVLCH